MPSALDKALNRLCKWRQVYAGWQLGTRRIGDPESDAIRDSIDRQLILRAEVSALTTILFEKNIVTREEHAAALTLEADELCKMLERKFPGFKATDEGMSIDPKLSAATTRGWRP